MLMIHNEPIRLISTKRARTLRKKGVFVGWSPEHYSHYWYWSDLVDRQPKHSVSFESLMLARRAGL
jgi:hypothetical protein